MPETRLQRTRGIYLTPEWLVKPRYLAAAKEIESLAAEHQRVCLQGVHCTPAKMILSAATELRSLGEVDAAVS